MVKHTWNLNLLLLLCTFTIILRKNSVFSKITIIGEDGKDANVSANSTLLNGSLQEADEGDAKIVLAPPIKDSGSAEADASNASDGPDNSAAYPREKPEKSKHIVGYLMTDEEIEKFHLWKDGYIPYYIDVKSFSEKGLRDNIRSILNMVNSMTPLQFSELPAPPRDDTRFVFFVNRIGLLDCANHSVWDFTNEGAQRVILGYHCMSNEGELLQAVMAIAGVPAQHTAPDRDDYIQVFLENVEPDYKKYFDKLKDSDWLFHDLPYDYDSIGHFSSYKYSMNGRTVIRPLKADTIVGESKGLSFIDIKKIKLLYAFKQNDTKVYVQTCDKLFQKGSQFTSYTPNPNIAKPQRKPKQYIGDNAANIDYIDDRAIQKLKHVVSGNAPASSNEDLEVKGPPLMTLPTRLA